MEKRWLCLGEGLGSGVVEDLWDFSGLYVIRQACCFAAGALGCGFPKTQNVTSTCGISMRRDKVGTNCKTRVSLSLRTATPRNSARLLTNLSPVLRRGDSDGSEAIHLTTLA